MAEDLFPGFVLAEHDIPKGRMRVRHGGAGPPVLLLHGHPRTHITWAAVAPRLARRFTVVCPDLPGFGRSRLGGGDAGTKRAKAAALVALMERLGRRRFAVAGHDRGCYTAFRMALDHPDRVERLAVLDGIPIIEALERCDARFAAAWWHWFFYARPDIPERVIGADPLAWYGASIAACRQHLGEKAAAELQAALTDPDVIRGMLDDYRAGLRADRDHDAADRAAGRRITCPVLCLWSAFDDLEELHGDVCAIWRRWAPDIRGGAIASGHHMAEEAPDSLADALEGFLDAGLSPRPGTPLRP